MLVASKSVGLRPTLRSTPLFRSRTDAQPPTLIPQSHSPNPLNLKLKTLNQPKKLRLFVGLGTEGRASAALGVGRAFCFGRKGGVTGMEPWLKGSRLKLNRVHAFCIRSHSKVLGKTSLYWKLYGM